MPAVTGTIANLLNGVSSQAVALRLPTQGEEQINGYSALTRGLIKRPPTRLLKNIGTISGASTAYIHTINRDASEKYIVMITSGDLKVYDIAGNEKTVTFPNGKTYLSSGVTNASRDFSAVSVNDYTFIVNKTKVTSLDATNKTATRSKEALITVNAGNYARKYKIMVDGTQAAFDQTPDGSNRAHYNAVDTTVIASHLWRALRVSGTWDSRDYFMDVDPAYGGSWDYSTIVGSGIANPSNSSRSYDAALYTNTIHLKNIVGADFTISANDGSNGSNLKAIKDVAQKFSDLPVNAPDGIVFEVQGDVETGADNYWVKYDAASLTWAESMKPGTIKGYDNSTMPHVLVRNADGTFTFKRADWNERLVGSDDNPSAPSFIGKKISSVFFHRNRLGFTADDNVILSEAGEYFNFWPRTLTTLLDSDPIDVGSSYTEVTTFRSAITFGGDLALFSDQAVFRLSGGDLLTPKTAAMRPYGAFNIHQYCNPEAVGTILMWTANDGERSLVREMWLDENGTPQSPLEANSHCPKYIPKNVKKITASVDLSLALFLSEEDDSTLYAYKYYWSGNDKPQASWSKWTFPFTILNMKFIDTTLYLVVKDGTNVMLLSMPCQVDYAETGQDFAILLDKRTTVTGTYSSSTDKTTYTLPYTVPSDIQAWTIDGHRQIVSSYTGTTVVLSGNTTGKTVYFGVPYEFLYKFSKLIMKQPSQNGGTVAVMDGRLQIVRMSVQYNNAAEFKVRVTSTNGNTRTLTQNASGFSLDDPLFSTTDVNLSQGKFSFPVKHENWTCDVELLNDSALPTDFVSADYTALFHPKTRRA